jgi:predicted transglutaminase-like cysteine proteinase
MVSWIPAQAGEVVTSWVMPRIAIPEAERPVGPNVLGTVALPIRAQPSGTRWSKLMRASADGWLYRFTADYRDLPQYDQARLVQSAVNHAVRSTSVTFNCSDDGYWAPASETLIRGRGDCFDIAIAKMEALRLLGFASRDLYLTTGRFRIGPDGNATRESVALLVRIDEQFWLLREQGDELVELSNESGDFDQFTPVITHGVGMSWIHGRPVKPIEPSPQLARQLSAE